MTPRNIFYVVLSLFLAFGLSSCLPVPSTGDLVPGPDEVRETVQAGIEATITTQERIRNATAAASGPASPAESLPLATIDSPTLTPAAATATRTLTQPPTATVTRTPAPTHTPTLTHTPEPTRTPQPTPTVFDPSTPTPTPPPTITPRGWVAPPDTPVPPPTETPLPPTETPLPPTETPTAEPELSAPEQVVLQISYGAYCRSGPGRSYDLLDVLMPDEWALVVGRGQHPNYYVIETPRGTPNCWLWATAPQIDGSLEGVPQVEAAPPPPLPVFTAGEDLVCRAGPDIDQPVITNISAGVAAEIIGRAEEDSWALVRLPLRWVSCWAPASAGQLSGNLAAAPVLGAVVLPAAQPSPTPTQTLAAAAPASQPVLTPVVGTACRILSQSPSTNTTVSPGSSFEASWTLRNIGSVTWESSLVDIHYLAGTRMHRTPDRFDLPQNIHTGESVTIRLVMAAPANPGRYHMTFAMSTEDTTFCAMPLSVEVR